MNTFSISFSSNEQLTEQLDVVSVQHVSSPLIQIFSDQTEDEIKSFYSAIIQEYPQAVVIGASANDVIQQGKIVRGSTYAVFSQFDQAEIRSAVVGLSGDFKQVSRELYLALEPNTETKAYICFGDQITANDQDLFSAFCSNSIPIAGGATTTTENGRWAFLNGEFYRHALVAVAIDSATLNVFTRSYNAWNPIGATFTVTKASGNILYELNHKPVHDIFKHYLADGDDIPAEKLHGFPLMKGEQYKQNVFSPRGFGHDGGYLLDRPLYEGDSVRFCYDHPELTIQQVREGTFELAKFQPEQIFVYNCTSRLDFIVGNAELTPLQTVAETNGFYCMGELFKNGDKQSILHHSMTYLAIREGAIKPTGFKKPQIDNASTISPLFAMIRNSFSDLEHLNSSMQEKIENQANQLISSYRTDRLTGLPNREVLRGAIARMSNSDNLITLKVSNLTDINEKYGYSVGDKILSHITQRLLEQLNKQTMENAGLFCIGVGEWATVFSSDITMDGVREQFSELIDKIETINFEQVGLRGNGNITAAICAGLLSKQDFPAFNPDAMLLKLIEARREAGKSHQSICNAKSLMDGEVQRKRRLDRIAIANHAITHGHVVPFAQAIYDASTKQVSSYECLVRLSHHGEILAPGFFLPYIQDTRIYRRMSKQMILNSFDLMKSRDDKFSINLSPQDILDEKTLLLIESLLQSINNPARVGFEIVESEQIKDFTRMIEACNRFRALGANIIVDDFGSGYSNIDEIIKLEPSIIKLDGSLIKTIDVDTKQRKIASQLIRLCKVFEAKTVAEFVHNQEVCQITTDIGADFLQGFYLSEPERLY